MAGIYCEQCGKDIFQQGCECKEINSNKIKNIIKLKEAYKMGYKDGEKCILENFNKMVQELKFIIK